jgi:phenylacetate-CoA ligase
MAGIRAGDHALISGRNLWHAAARAFDRAFERMGVVKHFFGTPSQEVIPHLFESAPEVLGLLNVTISLQPEMEVEYLRSRGLEPRALCPDLRILQTGVEMSTARRRLLEDAWGVPVHNHFGSGDQFWMTGQCPADERWNHAPEDYLVFEVLDPITREPVPDGGTGVLHVTNLWMRSFPFVRYDMEDMVAHTAQPCACGRTSRRLQMRGRLAWAIRVGGRWVFSQDVEEVLWAHPELTAPPYQLVRQSRQPQDRLEVRVAVELRPALRDELATRLVGALDMPVSVVEIPAGSIGHKGMKVERVVTV